MRRTIAALVLTAAALGALLSYRSPPPVANATGPIPSRFSSSRAPASSQTTRKYLGRVAVALQPKSGWSFGDVQVSVVMRGRRIVKVNVVRMPPSGDTGGVGTRPTTTDISSYAAPVLEREAVADQGVRLDSVSGATYTYEAFVNSLASALLQARS